jgi:hypothetical protein
VKARKHNPNIAIKICDECVRQYLCKECDEVAHRAHDARHHQRRTLVIGPGIRKRILRRGDAVSFPYSLDEVKVKLKSRVYHKGQIIHREPNSYAKFRVGLSGISVHVQVLGGRNLLISDINNTSDPFVTAENSTRRTVRPLLRSTNARNRLSRTECTHYRSCSRIRGRSYYVSHRLLLIGKSRGCRCISCGPSMRSQSCCHLD